MKEAIDQIFKELADLKAASAKEVEEARIRFLGKKGEVTALMLQPLPWQMLQLTSTSAEGSVNGK